MILKFVQRWFNKRTRDIMQGANADDCIPSWRILLCLVHSWKVRIAADPHANSPSQTEGRRPCLAPNPHDALCRFCSPSRTHAPNPHCRVVRGDTSSSVSRSWSICSGLQQSSDWPWQTRMRRRHRPWQEDRHRWRRHIRFHKLLSQGVVLLRRNEVRRQTREI